MAVRRALSFDPNTIKVLPTPIAHTLSELSNESSAMARLVVWQMCEGVELVVRFVATMLFSDVLARGKVVDLDSALKDFNFRQPTLGQWTNLFKNLIDRLPTDSAVFKELAAKPHRELFDKVFYGTGQPPYLWQFTRMRNCLAHGAGLQEPTARFLLDRWANGVDEWLWHVSSWLRQLKLCGRSGKDLFLLQGMHPATVDDPSLEAVMPGADLFVERAGVAIKLWPLMLFGVPKCVGLELNNEDLVVQVYSSFDNQSKRIYFTPIGCGEQEVLWSQADEATTIAFMKLVKPLRQSEEDEARGAWQSFRREIDAEAQLMMGRSAVLNKVLACCQDRPNQKFWIHGPAGCGKSSLMAKVVMTLSSRKSARSDVAATNEHSPLRIIPYRFRAGDSRCSTAKFLTLIRESVSAPGQEQGQQTDEVLAIKRGLREASNDGIDCMFVLDGLDEIHATEPDFIPNILLGLMAEEPKGRGRVTWLLAGRDEITKEINKAAGATSVFGSEGLPAMDERDVRAMILDQIGRKREGIIRDDLSETVTRPEKPFVAASDDVIKKLDSGILPEVFLHVVKPAAQTNEHGLRPTVTSETGTGNCEKREKRWLIDTGGENPEIFIVTHRKNNNRIIVCSETSRSDFISEVTKRAKGLPLYVKLVIDDIRDGQYEGFNRGRLPRDLARYYDRLLKRHRIDRLAPITTDLVCLIAIAKDALTVAQLDHLFVKDRLPGSTDEERRVLLCDALDVMGSMLRCQPNMELKIGYSLYHHSLREHLDPPRDDHGSARHRDQEGNPLDVWIANAKRIMAHMCSKVAQDGIETAGEFRSYSTRFGVGHLLDVGRYPDALRLLTRLRDWKGPDPVISPGLLAALANSAAQGLDRAVQTVRETAGDQAIATREALQRIDSDDLREFVCQTYETGVYTSAIRVLIEYHPEAWTREKRERLESPYDIVFRHDAGAAYAGIWDDSDTETRREWTGILTAMAKSAEHPYDREIAAYAFKHIYQENPKAIDREMLRTYSTSTHLVDRMVAGEILLSLEIRGVDTSDWVQHQEFWSPYWDYHKIDIDNVKFLRLRRLRAGMHDIELKQCVRSHDFADQLRRRLRDDQYFLDPSRKNLRALLDDYAAQQEHIGELDGSITDLGLALDGSKRRVVIDFIMLLMCHPLWNFIEQASSLVTKLIVRNSARWFLIDELIEAGDKHWGLRYGAVDAAYNAGQTDQFKKFRELLLMSNSWNVTNRRMNCRVQGICADDLLGWLRLSDRPTRDSILADPQIRRLVMSWTETASDSWILEYVYLLHRFLREAHADDALTFNPDDVLPRPQHLSRYLAGSKPFYLCTHQEFLERIEAIRRDEWCANP